MLSTADYASLVPVRNMARAIKFYTETLGGKVTFRGEGDMKDSWALLELGKENFWLITPETWEKRTLSYSVFLVKNIKKVVEGLQEKGVKFQKAEKMSKDTRIEGPIAFESFGASAFFKDSEGNLLMIWQNNPPM